jgi:tetratricopeptide (TPR) repeat protein
MDTTILVSIICAIAGIAATIIVAIVQPRLTKKKGNEEQPSIDQVTHSDSQNPTNTNESSDKNGVNRNNVIILPFPNKYFTGRTETLRVICQNLQEQKWVYITGTGGMGKSAIALQYAHKHKDNYDVILWINADEQNKVQAGFKEFVLTKRLVSDYEKDESIILIRAKEWLKSNSRWLFIYDNANADDFNKWLEQYLPQNTTGDVIITTRDQFFPVGEKVGIDKFEVSEALQFLEKRAKRVDEKAKDLAEHLGCFPLALEQAGAYLEVTSTVSYGKYIESYEKNLEHNENLTHYDKSIYATLQISINKIKKDGAKQLLNICAYFAPDKIPMALFEESKIFTETFKIDTPIDNIVADLVKYSLVNRDQDNQSNRFFHMHRLLQKTVRRKHEDTQWLVHCLNIAYDVFNYEYGNIESMDAFAQNVSHVLEIAGYAEEMFSIADVVVQKRIAVLYNTAGYGFNYNGQYDEALEWYTKALAIREKVLGKEHPDTAATYNNMAGVYDSQGDYEKALEWYTKALAISEKVLGKEHPDTAATYNNMAGVYDRSEERDVG